MRTSTTQIPLGTQLNRSHSLLRGCIGYWPMNEGGGQKAFDATGLNNVPSALTNGAIFKITQKGNAISFDGTNDYSVITKSIIPTGTTPKSISLWFRTETAVSTRQWLVYAGSEVDFGRFSVEIQTSKFALNWFNASLLSPSVLVTQTWYHGVVTYNSSSNLASMYLNGLLVSSINPNASLTTGTTVNNYFGIFTNLTSFPFNGYMNNVMFYNRELLANEAMQLYTNQYQMFQGYRGLKK